MAVCRARLPIHFPSVLYARCTNISPTFPRSEDLSLTHSEHTGIAASPLRTHISIYRRGGGGHSRVPKSRGCRRRRADPTPSQPLQQIFASGMSRFANARSGVASTSRGASTARRSVPSSSRWNSSPRRVTVRSANEGGGFDQVRRRRRRRRRARFHRATNVRLTQPVVFVFVVFKRQHKRGKRRRRERTCESDREHDTRDHQGQHPT